MRDTLKPEKTVQLQDIARKMSAETGIPKKLIVDLTRLFLEDIFHEVEQGNEVRIYRFGRFWAKVKRSNRGSNETGESRCMFTPRFVWSKYRKDILKEKCPVSEELRRALLAEQARSDALAAKWKAKKEAQS